MLRLTSSFFSLLNLRSAVKGYKEGERERESPVCRAGRREARPTSVAGQQQQQEQHHPPGKKEKKKKVSFIPLPFVFFFSVVMMRVCWPVRCV